MTWRHDQLTTINRRPIADNCTADPNSALLPSKTERWSFAEQSECENDSFLRDIPQKLKTEVLKTTLWRETHFKTWMLKMSKRRFRARLPSKTLKVEVVKMKPELSLHSVRPMREWSEDTLGRLAPAERQTFPIHLLRRILCCKTEHFVHPITFKTAFRAKLPSKTDRERCENEDFLRDVTQKLTVADALKIWKPCFRVPKLRVEDVKKMLQSCLARFTSKTDSWSWENKASVRDLPSKLRMGLITAYSHLNSQLTLRSSRSPLSSLADPLPLGSSCTHLNLFWEHLIFISSHSHPNSLWHHLALISTHSQIRSL